MGVADVTKIAFEIGHKRLRHCLARSRAIGIDKMPPMAIMKVAERSEKFDVTVQNSKHVCNA